MLKVHQHNPSAKQGKFLVLVELYYRKKIGKKGEKKGKRKGEKERKSQKNVSKRHKIQDGPQSGTKQSIWRGYPTGRERGDAGLETKTDPKRRFRSSKIDEKPCRILRILLFSSSGFSDRLWQNDAFCCMICTSF